MTTCTQCDAENRDGAKFCGNCRLSLALACPRCGASNESGRPFATSAARHSRARPDRRLRQPRLRGVRHRWQSDGGVSVLFADLVGFTQLSESRDPEEVRELLPRYFESCRRLVELYGGVVEKFIGDAVMALPAGSCRSSTRALRDHARCTRASRSPCPRSLARSRRRLPAPARNAR